MIRKEYFKVINNTYLVHKTKDKITSVNDFIKVGDLTIDNKNNFTRFILNIDNRVFDDYFHMFNTIIKYDEIPKGFMVIHEVGVRAREFDNVKYFDVAGDLLFEYSWCE